MIRYRRLIIVAAVLIGVLTLGFVFISKSRGVPSQKQIHAAEGRNERPLMATFQTKDFPERGVHLIGPSNPSFAKLAQLVKNNEDSVTDLPPYSVFLQNRSSHSVVGYRITWECLDKKGETAHTDVSNTFSYIFLHRDESERIKAMACDASVIGPNSTWFISLDLPARRVEDIGRGQMEASTFMAQLQAAQRMDISKEFSKVTISLDGLFFDDGTFLGADTTAFFNEVQSEMDARYEILNKVESDLRSGFSVEEIVRKLEQIASQPMPQLPVSPSRSEYMNSFRVLFAKNVLGMKAVYGTEKAIEDVHQQLSKRWVHLRRL